LITSFKKRLIRPFPYHPETQSSWDDMEKVVLIFLSYTSDKLFHEANKKQK
jgi:hypothetical protein